MGLNISICLYYLILHVKHVLSDLNKLLNFETLNKIRVKSKMSRNEKKGHGGKHTRPKKWSGARRPAGPATTALY